MLKKRSGNIELMRIIAMLFIISHHLLVHGMKIWENSTWNNFVLLSIDSCFFIGVNVFVLISGYCGIKFNLKKLFYLYILTSIIGGLGYFVHLYVDDASLGKSVIYNTIFSISHAPGTWYIKVYIYLFLLSPIINISLQTFTRKQIHLVLFLLSVICVYFGWFWQDEVNKDGYNLINFIWLYCIGYYLSNHLNVNNSISIIYFLPIWIILSIVNVIIWLKFNSYVAWTYNNPFVVLASISFFLFFISLNFTSRVVNIIAQSTLGIYLIHENCYLSHFLYDKSFVEKYSNNVILFVASVFGVFIVCGIVDFIIRTLVVRPLMKITPPPTHTIHCKEK